VLHSEYLELAENNHTAHGHGRLDLGAAETRATLDETIERLGSNTGMKLNLCLSYGGARRS